MRSTTGVIVGAAAVAALILALVWYQSANAKKQGGLYVGVTDVTADIANVSDINATVNKVELHSVADGWITVSATPKTFGLLSLNASGKTQLYVREDVAEGSYDRVRLTFGDVLIKLKDGSTVRATMPSTQMVVNINTVVAAKQDSQIHIDIIASDSLHITSDGAYVFAPVAHMQSESNAKIIVAGDNSITSTEGKSEGDVKVGVDLDGSTKMNFKLVADGTLKMQTGTSTDNKGKIMFLLGGKSFMAGSADVETSEDASVDDHKSTATSSPTEQGGEDSRSGASVKVDLQGGLKTY